MEQQLNEIVKEVLKQFSTPEGLITLSIGAGYITMAKKILEQTTRTILIRKNTLENCKIVDKAPEITHLKPKPSNIENYPQINELVTIFKNKLEAHQLIIKKDL